MVASRHTAYDATEDSFRLRPLYVAVAIALGALASMELGREPIVAPSTSLSGVAGSLHAISTPLLFERNVGQFPPSVAFAAHARGFLAAVEGARIVFHLPGVGGDAASSLPQAALMTFIDAAVSPRVEATRAHASRINRARGSPPAAWTMGVPTFTEIRVRDLYPGVDLALFGTAEGVLEYNLVLAPGADVSRVRFRVRGAERLEIARDGSLLVHLRGGILRHGRPQATLATASGATPVPTRYRIVGSDIVAFDVEAPAGSDAITIDPTLNYASYVGGSGIDAVNAVAAAADGGFFVAGSTTSASLAGGGYRADRDAYVARYDAFGRLQYTTFLGGSGSDAAHALAVDGALVVVAGTTCSADFPVLAAAQPTYGGNCDAFITWLDAATGTIERSTFLGGSGEDNGAGVAMAAGATAVAGRTSSFDFPTKSATFGYAGGNDAFLTRYGSDGAVAFSTTIGGYRHDDAAAVALATTGVAYVAGVTASPDFPRFNTALPGPGGRPDERDGWAASFTASGTLRYATTIGGSGDNAVAALALGGEDQLWIAGPTVAAPGMFPPSRDAFVMRLDRPPGASTSVATGYARTFGGSNEENPLALVVRADGQVTIAGVTYSTDLPTVEPLQARRLGIADAFVATIDPGRNGVAFATYLGGTGYDEARALAVLAGGDLLVGGSTYSFDFPLLAPQNGGNTLDSGFVARLGSGSPGLNDTGDLTTCLAGSGAPACQSLGYDRDTGRDAAYLAGALPKQGAGLHGFDFSRVTNAGQVLPATATPPLGSGAADWACTRDNTTGLTWEVKAADGGIRDRLWRYTWHSTIASENGGNPGNPGTSQLAACGSTLPGCATDAYIAALNAARLCGFADWRMPTARELQSIAVTSTGIPLRIDAAFFPTMVAAPYWTATPLASAPEQARVHDFGTGSSEVVSKSLPLRVIAVRGPRR